MNTAADKLRSNLAAQLQASREIEDLIEQEQAALRVRAWPQVQAHALAQAGPVQRLQNLHRDLLVQAGTRTPAEHVQSLGQEAAWNDLLASAARLQQANRESRALLDAQQSKVESALRLLRPGSESSLYGRNGRRGLSAPSLRLASA